MRNISVVYGAGLSIGSVPPDPLHSCVRRVTFEDSHFQFPLKAIYIKTNPCDRSLTPEECALTTGEIRDILYERISAVMPIWWGIYIGPQ